MEDEIRNLQEKFPGIEYEVKEYFPLIETEDDLVESDVPKTFYRILSIAGNDNVTIDVESPEEVGRLSGFLENDPVIFKDFAGIKYADQVEILLRPVSRFTPHRFFRETNKALEISIFFRGIEYLATIQKADKNHLISYFAENVRQIRNRGGIILILRRKKGGEVALGESLIRELLFSVLFDIEYTYSIALETQKYLGPIRQAHRGIRPPALPDAEISLIYKKYIPELIEYFHTAEKVDYLPFKYICYFHIVEYFMDKSAYSVASKKVKELLLKPDFHLNSNTYIAEAINIFKKENDRYQTDKIKINRVFKEFFSPEEIKTLVENMGLIDHFSKDEILQCAKPLTITGINFDVENEFYNSISKRVYSLRCSIVHSNPDFDESKAIPFTPNEENLFFLRKEMVLLKEIAKTIIAKSSETT